MLLFGALMLRQQELRQTSSVVRHEHHQLACNLDAQTARCAFLAPQPPHSLSSVVQAQLLTETCCPVAPIGGALTQRSRYPARLELTAARSHTAAA